MRPYAILAAAILFSTGTMHAAVKAIPSFGEPSISPDRSEIAFVSGGDIWTVPAKGGQARLLVAHPATESRPLYSPDGKQLAFNSTRTGNGDIYVLTFATGDVRRITYSDATESLSGWSRDGQWLYFDTNSNDINQSADIFRVRASGGTPLEVARDRFYSEFRGAPSPDGSEIALVAKGFSNLQWWRHGHSHLDESEIWLKGVAEGSPYKQLVAEDAKQGWPMWSADSKDLFYTSDRTGAENLFRLAVSGGASKQITHFDDGRLLWPSISFDGKEIVFERNFTIWKVDTRSGAPAEIPIELRGASSTPAVTHLSLTQFTGLALSPDGKKVAVLAHGDVFASSATDAGDAQRITNTAAPETGVQWEANSNRLVYVSTRNGHAQIFEYDLAKNTEQQLTAAEEDDAGLALSPDGKTMAFVRGDHSLHAFNLQTKADKELASGDLQEPVLSWSPDSRFVAYTSFGAKSFRNVNVVGVNGGIGQPVSFLANGESASRIAWSPDGKYLLFDTAQRSEPSQLARVDLVPHLPKLREEQFRELFRDKEPTTPEQPATRQPEKPQPKPAADGTLAPATDSKDEKANKKPEPTRIVFEGIRQRLGFLAIGLDANGPVISPDGKTVVFLAATGNQRNIYSYSLDELAIEPATARQLTSTSTPKSTPVFTADSKTVYFLDGGHVTSMPVETHIPKPIAITAALDVDFDADKIAAFEQGWQILNKRYYDPRFHGQNWAKLRERYEPYVAGSRTPDEMRRVTNLMIGELNSSHSGIGVPPGTTNSTPFNPAPTPVGRLGLNFEREPYEAGKGLIVREVVPLSPAALDGHVKVGDRLVSVDGEVVGPDVNLDSLLQNKVNRRVVLQIAGSGGKPQEVVVRPVSFATEVGLLYRSWVESNRAYVERASRGKLGYVHLRDMSEQSLNQLYIDLDVQNQTKQGVVIDIRDNNGGFVNEYALDVFTRKNYLTMTPRGSKPAPARPFLGQRALGLPTVLVTNQGSLSDAEDFTEGYRALRLGKVVGEPTAGWIIYTGGAVLIDGSALRTPQIRVQAADGEDMELHPRPVDVEVERKAGEWLAGKDVQLDRAVKELQGSASEHP